jgi:ribosomal protein S18 acetylase RimI-like enzyme
MLGPYCREGLVVCQRVVAIQGHLRAVLRTDPPIGVTIRPGRPEDLSAVERLETECFDTFWCYGKTELLEQVATDRLVVAETGEGRLVGYTLASVSRGAVALGRLGVGKAARRCGLGRALVAEVAQWAEESGAETISLCTQEENAPGRRLYRSVGLAEISDTYGLAIGSVAGER